MRNQVACNVGTLFFVHHLTIEQYPPLCRRIALRQTLNIRKQAALSRSGRADDADDLAAAKPDLRIFHHSVLGTSSDDGNGFQPFIGTIICFEREDILCQLIDAVVCIHAEIVQNRFYASI